MGQKYRPNYWKNAALLTGSDVVLRLAGLGLRIGLANALGGEGMGLYQLILAVYMVFVSLATAGINVASARLAAQSLARGRGMAATLRGLCGTALLFGCCAMLLQVLLAELSDAGMIETSGGEYQEGAADACETLLTK